MKIKVYSADKAFPKFDGVAELFRMFYTEMEHQGLLLSLASGGEKAWIDSLRQRLGKIAALFVAEDANALVGFSSGFIKLLPAILGGGKIGFIDGLYVLPGYRGQKIASDLYSQIEDWLMQQKVQNIELQVLVGNLAGYRFWQSKGYTAELYQMRKIIKK